MDRAKLEEMLNALTPAGVRALMYEVHGGHRCDASTNLITCCGEARCQACHIPHLKERHSLEELYAYQKFVRAGTLTWQVKEYKKPLVPKMNKKRSRDRRVANDPVSVGYAVPDDQLEQVLAMLAARMKK